MLDLLTSPNHPRSLHTTCWAGQTWQGPRPGLFVREWEGGWLAPSLFRDSVSPRVHTGARHWMAKTAWALMSERKPQADSAHQRVGRERNGSGSAPNGPGRASFGRSCLPFPRFLLLPGRCWASGAASLSYRTGSPRRREGEPAPQPGSLPAAALAPREATRKSPSPWTRGRPPLEERSGGAAS